jgi:two-component sensor histidine kinase
MDIAQAFKECAVNLEILLALFEDRGAYGKSTINFIDYIVGFLSEIEKAFHFNKFDFRTRVLVKKDIKCKTSPLRKIAKILYELCLNALNHGGLWVEIDIHLDENDILTLRFTDKGGWFDIDREVEGKGLKIIKNYANLVNLEDTPITREQNTTIILFNFKPIIVR